MRLSIDQCSNMLLYYFMLLKLLENIIRPWHMYCSIVLPFTRWYCSHCYCYHHWHCYSHHIASVIEITWILIDLNNNVYG